MIFRLFFLVLLIPMIGCVIQDPEYHDVEKKISAPSRESEPAATPTPEHHKPSHESRLRT